MNSARLGSQTVKLIRTPSVLASASAGGKLEGEGPLRESFDYLCGDSYFGEKSWESAESAMLKTCYELALAKARLNSSAINYLFSGDLLNQCVGSAFAAKDSSVPYFGLYGACSTMAESLSLAAIAVDGWYADTVCALTSAHFCSAERQFRTPLAYGGQRTPTAQWTATAAGAVIVTREGNGPYITHLTTGKIVDGGVKDANNMGAAMAPAALETLCAHFEDTGRSPDYYDLIVTGDLGSVGHEIVVELAAQNGADLSKNYNDCGLMLYDREKQDVHAGGSGCGCGASVLAGYLLPKVKSGEIKRLLFAATGALMSPTTTMQGDSILGICHAVAIEKDKPAFGN